MSEQYAMPSLQRRTWMASILWTSVSCAWTRDPWCLPLLQLSGRSSKEQVCLPAFSKTFTQLNIYNCLSWFYCVLLLFLDLPFALFFEPTMAWSLNFNWMFSSKECKVNSRSNSRSRYVMFISMHLRSTRWRLIFFFPSKSKFHLFFDFH